MRIWLSRPHMSGREEVYVAEAFESNFIAPLGPQLDAFEAAVSDFLGGHMHCVGLSSGSAALHLGGMGLGHAVLQRHRWLSTACGFATAGLGVFMLTRLA